MIKLKLILLSSLKTQQKYSYSVQLIKVAKVSRLTTSDGAFATLRSFIRVDQSLNSLSAEWCLYLGNARNSPLFSAFLCYCVTPVTLKSSTSSCHLKFGLFRPLFPPGCHSSIVLIVLLFPGLYTCPKHFIVCMLINLSMFSPLSFFIAEFY